MKQDKKRYYIILFIIIVIFYGITAININADSQGKPEISINIKAGYPTPDPGEIGEEIEIAYTVTPEPIGVDEVNSKKDKEVIFVIDTSESMYKCIEHDKYINVKPDEYEQCEHHSDESFRRLNIVKESLKNLINEIRNVENLKVGIVTYSYIGQVHNYNSSMLLEVADNKQYNQIMKIIDNLQAEGATNTGDGLRQGAAILKNSDNKDANKSIVFFTDGMPSRYTVSKNNKFETSLSGSATDRNKVKSDTGAVKKSLEYATAIGELINKEKYNVISIACAVNENASKNIKEIHQSMGGKEEDIFLANDEETLKNIFDSIAHKIKEEIEIKGVNLALKEYSDVEYIFDEGSYQKENGYIQIQISNIVYKLNEERTLYVAEPFDIFFKIKSNKEGTIIINEESYLSYEDIYLNIIEKEIPTVKLNLLNKNTPNIDVELISERKVEVAEGEEILIEYEVKPMDFISQLDDEEGGAIEEVIFLLDTSRKMAIGNRYSQIQNGIVNSVLNNKALKNTKIGVITFSYTTLVGDRNKLNDPKDVSMKKNITVTNLLQPLFSLEDANSKDGFRQLFQNGKITISESDERNINEALILASDIYKEFGDHNKNKAVVILTSGEMKYSREAIDAIKGEEIKVITLDISDNNENNIEKLHGDLGGDPNDYIIGTINGGNYNSVDADMAEVAKRLLSTNKKLSFETINAKLHFAMDTNFNYVDESHQGMIKDIISEGDKLIINLEDIIYQYQETVNGQAVYGADSFRISFKVAVSQGKSGELKFGENNEEQNIINNYIIYNKFNKKQFVKGIDTPVVKVLEEYYEISHGIYNGIKDNKIAIEEEEREFLVGTKVNLAASLEIRKSEKIILDLDKKGILSSVPTVYEFINGNLKKIGEMTKDNDKFYYNVQEYHEKRCILILYTYTLGDELSLGYINDITVANSSKKAVLRAVKAADEGEEKIDLPNLF